MDVVVESTRCLIPTKCFPRYIDLSVRVVGVELSDGAGRIRSVEQELLKFERGMFLRRVGITAKQHGNLDGVNAEGSGRGEFCAGRHLRAEGSPLVQPGCPIALSILLADGSDLCFEIVRDHPIVRWGDRGRHDRRDQEKNRYQRESHQQSPPSEDVWCPIPRANQTYDAPWGKTSCL